MRDDRDDHAICGRYQGRISLDITSRISLAYVYAHAVRSYKTTPLTLAQSYTSDVLLPLIIGHHDAAFVVNRQREQFARDLLPGGSILDGVPCCGHNIGVIGWQP